MVVAMDAATAADLPRAAGESRQAQSEKSRAWPTVLVVDDEERNRVFLRPVLRDHYRIIEAESAAAAFAILERERVDLVLLDVMMPEMTGFEACKLIKERHRDAFLPVLLVTGLTDQQQ